MHNNSLNSYMKPIKYLSAMNKFLFTTIAALAAVFSCMAASPGKFVIYGSVYSSDKISEVVIYSTDLDQRVMNKDSVASIPVVDNEFCYTTNLDDIKQGRLKVVFSKDSFKNSESIDIAFVPDFTLYISVYDGYCSITNLSEFKRKAVNYMENNHPNEHLDNEKIISSAANNSQHKTIVKSADDNNSNDIKEILNADIPASVKEKYVMAELRKEILQTKLDQYKQMLKYISDKISCSKNHFEVSHLIQQQDKVLELMQQAIDDYDINL